MDDHELPKPIFEGRDLTRLSTFSEPQSAPRRKSVPAAVGRIIGELGLRYRPAIAADLEAHAHALKLLTEDVADIPAELLERAAKQWVRQSRFMPKASELVDMARGLLSSATKGSDYGGEQLQEHCDRLNAMKCGWRWQVIGKAPNRYIERAA